VYKQVLVLNESGMLAKDVLERSLEFYKVKHPKQLSFIFLHCWLILKDVPRWWDSPTDVQQRNTRKERTPVPMPKRSNEEVPASAGNADVMAEEDDVEIVRVRVGTSVPAMPPDPCAHAFTQACYLQFAASLLPTPAPQAQKKYLASSIPQTPCLSHEDPVQWHAPILPSMNPCFTIRSYKRFL
jgi:hypothetical protein